MKNPFDRLKTGHPIVDAIGELEDKLVGNLIPDSWFKAILDGRGLPDWLAISILADIVYWYRPSETTKHDKRVARKKFKWDWLQFNRGHAAQKFGVSEDAISAALSRLDKLRAIQRDYRDVTIDGRTHRHLLFVCPVPEIIKKLCDGGLTGVRA